MIALLGTSGWRVDVAPDGRAAHEDFRATRREGVCDLRVADGDSQTLSRHAMAQDADYARRFVFVAGAATERAPAFAERADVPVIAKPFQPATFEEAVFRVVMGAAAGAGAPSRARG